MTSPDARSESLTRPWPWLDPAEDEERVIRFTKAYHRCNDPKGNFGIGNVCMVWVLRVGDYAIGWDCHTGWGMPDEAFHEADPACDHPRHQGVWPAAEALGGAVDFHYPHPPYEGALQAQDRCTLTGAPCWLDTGYLLGSEIFDLLRTEGDEAVWNRLREMLDDMRSQGAEIGRSSGSDGAAR